VEPHRRAHTARAGDGRSVAAEDSSTLFGRRSWGLGLQLQQPGAVFAQGFGGPLAVALPDRELAMVRPHGPQLAPTRCVGARWRLTRPWRVRAQVVLVNELTMERGATKQLAQLVSAELGAPVLATLFDEGMF
jgi:hypothetical protein